MSAAVMCLTCSFGKINPNCSWNLRKATYGKFFVNMSMGLLQPGRKTMETFFVFNAFVEGCQVQQPTLSSGLVRVTVSSYLCCMEVGTISYYKVRG